MLFGWEHAEAAIKSLWIRLSKHLVAFFKKIKTVIVLGLVACPRW